MYSPSYNWPAGRRNDLTTTKSTVIWCTRSNSTVTQSGSIAHEYYVYLPLYYCRSSRYCSIDVSTRVCTVYKSLVYMILLDDTEQNKNA
jgi:hypothetical protein